MVDDTPDWLDLRFDFDKRNGGSGDLDGVARRLDTLERLLLKRDAEVADRERSFATISDAVSAVAGQLSTILNHVTESIRHSRTVSSENEQMARHLSGGFYHAAQQLTDAAGELRQLMGDGAKDRDRTSAAEIDDLRTSLRDEIRQARNDVAEEVAALRKLVVRERREQRHGGPALDEALEAVRSDVVEEIGALVAELHEERALVMQQLVASRAEMQQLREELAQAIGGTTGQRNRLDSEISRLLIELRALRRRPGLDPVPAPASRVLTKPR